MKAKLIKTGNHYTLYYRIAEENIIIGFASTDNTFEKKLSLKNCEAIERGYDLDELTNDVVDEICEIWHIGEEWLTAQKGFKLGFQKALELLGDKKYSEEDVISMIEKSRETVLTSEYLILTKQQTEWDVTYNPDEKDSDGCLILKRI